ncbi:hypothetical protein FocnCong_v019723 [Fusarium oxysporum f. sp. conglutinans]|nr:hypothetical protein FocnCong_v019723 [Fusarium oxysporum f. sp. conglutinans]
MDKKRPSIVWIDTKKDKYEVEPYFHPVLDQLLHIPGNDGYIGRGLRQVQGNVLRGRTSWQNTLNLWFLDPDVTPPQHNNEPGNPWYNPNSDWRYLGRIYLEGPGRCSYEEGDRL